MLRPIRVLIVDDSVVTRSLLRLVLATEPRIHLAGMAPDGARALAETARLDPDLVLLDIEMPGMDGIAVLDQLRRRHPALPVIMCSTLTRRGAAITLDALARGAADYVTKPMAQNGVNHAVESLAAELIPKILALAGIAPEAAAAAPLVPLPRRTSASAPLSAVAIGVSTGGPLALGVVLPGLPIDFPLPVFVVQHMPELFTRMLAERLDAQCALRVVEAESGAVVQPGVVYLARGDWHMEVDRCAGQRAAADADTCTLRLTQAAPQQFCRPSVNVLFHSAVRAYGAGVLGVMLTGMGSDGLEGCRAIHAAGGTLLAQDRVTSAVWGMPGVVAEAGLADRVLPVAAIAPEILRVAASRSRRERLAAACGN